MSRFRTILYSVKDGVARLVLNRPAVRNGLSRAMTDEIREAVERAVADPQARVLLLSGAGAGFCSGADLGAVNTDTHPDRRLEQSLNARTFVEDSVNPMMAALFDCPKPIVAAVQGAVVGGGIGLALAADVVLVGETTRFMPKFTPQLALIPDLGSTWTLPRLVGRQRAMGMALLGETISGPTAAAWGMAWACFPDAELSERAEAIATRLAAGPPEAMAAAKTALRQSGGNDVHRQLDVELELAATCCGSLEFCEAATAFFEKRPPNFQAAQADQGSRNG